MKAETACPGPRGLSANCVLLGAILLMASCSKSGGGSPSPPENLVYAQNPASYQVGTAIPDNAPSVQGKVSTYSVSPMLPPGLDLDSKTGFISGTPTAARSASVYTVTASNSAGSTTADVQITVIDIAPTNLSYSQPNASYSAGIPIVPNVPTITGNVDAYTSSPALPPGLTLDPLTGVISGTGTARALANTYTITATNSGGSTNADVMIEVIDFLPKPGSTGSYFYDFNDSGNASEFRIVEMSWGRLADVYDIDALTDPSAPPLFTNFVIEPDIQTDGLDYTLEIKGITQQTKLIIHRPSSSPEFEALLRAASDDLQVIQPKDDDGTSSPPFSMIARNGCLVVRCDDLLDQTAALPENVLVRTGYPPDLSFSGRLLFDPNHGGETQGAFHSTRVLIDLTVSEVEAAGVMSPVNPIGLPESVPGGAQPNVSVRIPTQVDMGSGQFDILRNLSGAGLAITGNGPVDLTSPTQDVVRAMRSGNSSDTNHGFLLDLGQPEILGGWPVTVLAASDDPGGAAGLDFLLDIQFTTPCQQAPVVGDVLSVGSDYLEVTVPGGTPDGMGQVTGVNVRALTGPIPNASSLLGSGLYLLPYDPASSAPLGCWISFVPAPGVLPDAQVSPSAQVVARFSEPMDPSSVVPFENFILVHGDVSATLTARNIVVGEVDPSTSLREYSFTPLLPFAHTNGTAEDLHVELSGATDLAGNPLVNDLPNVGFALDPGAPTEVNDGIVLRFGGTDEIGPDGSDADGFADWRGQFLYDFSRGVMQPRPVLFSSYAADRSNPIPGLMFPFPPGAQTPLSPLGSKLQTIWRYVDLGWSVRDETKYNVDVIGLSWAPTNGQVFSDYYEDFEIRLSHCRKQPAEDIDGNLSPRWPNSGLEDAPQPYVANIVDTARSPQEIVHPRSLGYVVDPASLYNGVSGTLLVPFPMNLGGGSMRTFTWRDTAELTKAADDGPGIPMPLEVRFGLDPGPVGSLGGSGQVPSLGLPLLMEYRCFPSNSGVGLNRFDISFAVGYSSRPNFRAYSTGGYDIAGNPVEKDPDLEDVPSGGFNPLSFPPGQPTTHSADDVFYIGQLDLVIRVSRVHSVWLDTVFASPSFLDPIVDPGPQEQPGSSQMLLDYRGADGFVSAGNAPFDASTLDPYGDLDQGTVTFHGGVNTWTDDITTLDGSRYIQVRLSFINDIELGASPILSGLGIAFEGN